MVSTISVLFCITILSGIVLVSHGASYMSVCPSGWNLHDHRCFKFVSQKRDFAEAEVNCQHIGGNLASVHNADEYTFIRDMVKQEDSSEPRFWLGMSDSKKEGTWLWSDGDIVDFFLWNKGEPNSGGNIENCVEGNFRKLAGWNDASCATGLASVCVFRYVY